MILRRIIAHFRKQEWTAIAIDFVIVVLGVFIGIQVSNWNAARVEAQKQEVYLERLREDFAGIRARLTLHLKHYETAADGADYVLSIIRTDREGEGGLPIDNDRLERGLDALMSPRIPPALPATYAEMVSEGQLSGVKPAALRDKLAEYDRLMSIVQEVSRVVTDRSNQLTLVMYRHLDMRAIPDDDNFSGISLRLLSYNIGGMRDDRDFFIAVTLLREDALNSLGQRNFQLSLINDIIDTIDKERAP